MYTLSKPGILKRNKIALMRKPARMAKRLSIGKQILSEELMSIKREKRSIF